jgi:hypothetical protein
VSGELSTVQRPPVTLAALRLCRALEHHGITADPHEGDQVAALSVTYGLVVWCEYGPDGLLRYRWWTGRLSERTGRWVYTLCPADAPTTAARRLAERYRELSSLAKTVQRREQAAPWPI